MIHPFKQENKQCLKLRLGDIVVVKFSNGEWFKGATYDPKQKIEKKGFFPVANISFSSGRKNRMLARRDYGTSEKKFDLDKVSQLDKLLELPLGSWWELELNHPLFSYVIEVFSDWAPHFETWLTDV